MEVLFARGGLNCPNRQYSVLTVFVGVVEGVRAYSIDSVSSITSLSLSPVTLILKVSSTIPLTC